MKTEVIVAAKDLVSQIFSLQGKLSTLVGSYKNQRLIERLVGLEKTRAEERSEDQNEQIQLILEALSENPPYKKASYPSPHGPQPLPPATPEQYRRIAVAQAEQNAQALDAFTAIIPEGTIFEVVDGYGPMQERQAKALLVQRRLQEALATASMSRWQRFSASLRNLFRRSR